MQDAQARHVANERSWLTLVERGWIQLHMVAAPLAAEGARVSEPLMRKLIDEGMHSANPCVSCHQLDVAKPSVPSSSKALLKHAFGLAARR